MLDGVDWSVVNCVRRYSTDVLATYGGVSDGGKVQPGHLSGGTQLMTLDDLVRASRMGARANMRGKS